MRLLILTCFAFIIAFGLFPQSMYAQKKVVKSLPFSYSHVRVYEYNLDGKLFGAHHPIQNEKLAPSIQGHGVALSRVQREWLLKFLNEDLSLIEAGLGKCYIPHHAFVFFDSTNKPVAYVSACLLCDGIDQSWMPKPAEPKYNKKTLARAEDQMKRLGQFISTFGFPTDMNIDSYPKYAEKKQFVQDKANKDAVVIVPADFWEKCFRKGNPNMGYSICNLPVSIEKQEIPSEDGARYQLRAECAENIIVWDDENELPRMVEFVSNHCWLENGLKVGMTVEGFINITGAPEALKATEVLVKDEAVNFDFRISFYGGFVTKISGMRYK